MTLPLSISRKWWSQRNKNFFTDEPDNKLERLFPERLHFSVEAYFGRLFKNRLKNILPG
jgi:hypothetical protein